MSAASVAGLVTHLEPAQGEPWRGRGAGSSHAWLPWGHASARPRVSTPQLSFLDHSFLGGLFPSTEGWPPAACAPSPCVSPTSDLWAPACSGQGRDGAALLWLGAAPRGEGGGMYRTTARSKSSLSGSLGSLPGRDTQGGRRLKMALKTGSPSVLLDFEIICRSYLNIS